MTLPGMPGSQVSNDGDIMRIIADLQRQVRELAAQNVLATAGITTQTNGVTVSGSLNVSGDTNFTGNTTIGGNASITGNVSKSNSWGTSNLGPVVFGTGGPALTFTKSGTTYGQPVGIGLTRNGSNTADQVTINGPETADPAYIVLRSDKTFSVASDSSNVGPEAYSSAGSGGILYLLGGQTNGGVSIQSYGTGKCQVYGNFAVTGTKAFIMDHPVHPDTMELMHAATESPVNGVEYWGESVTGTDGTVAVILPNYFEALTKTEGRNIQLTALAPCGTAPWATRVIDGSFTINAPAGVEVHWLVKAERQRVVDGYDELSFPVEQDKVLIGPQLPEATASA